MLLGVDVGGRFTDAVLAAPDGGVPRAEARSGGVGPLAG